MSLHCLDKMKKNKKDEILQIRIDKKLQKGINYLTERLDPHNKNKSRIITDLIWDRINEEQKNDINYLMKNG